jgi:hypothetical protein
MYVLKRALGRIFFSDPPIDGYLPQGVLNFAGSEFTCKQAIQESPRFPVSRVTLA